MACILSIFYDAVTCKIPINDSLAVIIYTPPAMEGANITIKCSVDDARTNLITDNYTLTCINGQWESNLDQILTECQGTLQKIT